MDELQGNIDFKIPSFVSKAIEPSFTWETVIGYLAHCADNDAGGPIGLMYYKLPSADQIDSIEPVKDYLGENLKQKIIGVDMYVALTTKGSYKYSSDNDVIIWNVLGTGELSLDGEVRDVEPGDLMYIPAEAEYTFKPNQARAYVLFSIERGSQDGSN